MTMRSQVVGYVAFLAICLGAAGLGTVATNPEIDEWYRTIRKPSWNPPNWIFGPVWTTLYIMMATAAWLVWKARESRAIGLPLTLFGMQLALNIAWSWIFFYGHQPGWAAAEIVLLWVAIAATIAAFLRVSRTAGLLLIPYLAWVSFAAVLNVTIWRMNVA